jgi:hypothetical protein
MYTISHFHYWEAVIGAMLGGMAMMMIWYER